MNADTAMRMFVIFMIAVLVSPMASCSGSESSTTTVSTSPVVGDTVQGDWNGDGMPEKAFGNKIKEGSGNPMEDGSSDQWAIKFNATAVGSFDVGCCRVILINEGDLNGDGSDELAVFQSPMNGCTYTLKVYSYKKGEWHEILDPLLIPSACEDFRSYDLEKRVFIEKGVVYVLENDMNDEDFKLIKKEVKLKQ